MADEQQHAPEEVPDAAPGSQPAATPDTGDYQEPGPVEGNDQDVTADPEPVDLPEGGKREQLGSDPSHADPTRPAVDPDDASAGIVPPPAAPGS